MSDIDPRGLAAARRYARWHLGYSTWADKILDAYLDPGNAHAELDKEE